MRARRTRRQEIDDAFYEGMKEIGLDGLGSGGFKGYFKRMEKRVPAAAAAAFHRMYEALDDNQPRLTFARCPTSEQFETAVIQAIVTSTDESTAHRAVLELMADSLQRYAGFLELDDNDPDTEIFRALYEAVPAVLKKLETEP
jgi:hypothetical protein